LEVLSAHGREFARQKFLKGNETDKIYAALVYELTRAGLPSECEENVVNRFNMSLDSLGAVPRERSCSHP
jgi:hypothetical protein